MQTLAELKAENAAKEKLENPEVETEVETEVEEVEETEAELEAAEVEEEEEVADEEDGETESESTEAQEDWLNSGDTSEGQQMPVSAHIKTRTKLRGQVNELKEENTEKDQKIAQLEELLNAQRNVISPPSQIQRPSRYDFDSDEEYEDAYEKYQDARLRATFESQYEAVNRQQEQVKARQSLENEVNAHYERAAKVIEERGISPEVYQKSDSTVRRAIDSVMQGQGDIVTDSLIASLGEGSEKVMHHIGINEGARALLVNKLLNDPNGIQASMYLGELKGKLLSSKPSKISSNAPAPAKRVKGGGGLKAGESKLKKAYDKAAKEGNFQKTFDIRREAKKAGFNPNNW